MKIAICGTQYDNHFNTLLSRIIEILKQYDVGVVLEASFSEFVRGNSQINLAGVEICRVSDIDVDMAISFGGDGTFLATAKHFWGKDTGILGVNAGHLGFLADISEKELDSVLLEVIEGKYKVEYRSMLEVSLSNSDESVGCALNDVALLRQDTASMIYIDMYIDSEFVTSYKADGLLISTPTGSTAYSLSLGGPILAPQTHNFLVVPIAPHSLTMRPLVIGDDSVVELKVKSRSANYQLVIDGNPMKLPETVSVKIQKSKHCVKCIQPLHHTFFKTIRKKLMWGV